MMSKTDISVSTNSFFHIAHFDMVYWLKLIPLMGYVSYQKNQYIVEKHLAKDYAEWKVKHDKKATL